MKTRRGPARVNSCPSGSCQFPCTSSARSELVLFQILPLPTHFVPTHSSSTNSQCSHALCGRTPLLAKDVRNGAPASRRALPRRRYFGCGTIRKYGLGDFQPSGYFCCASSFDTEGRMMTSPPCFQFAGVATLCLAVS